MSSNSDIEKDQLILEFVNELMANMGKPEIKELTDFKNVTKAELSTEQNNELAKEYANKFIKYFKKKDIRYYDISRSKNYVGILLKRIIQPDYKLNHSHKLVMKDMIATYDSHYFISHNGD